MAFGATLQDVKDGNSMFDIINSLQEYIFLYRSVLMFSRQCLIVLDRNIKCYFVSVLMGAKRTRLQGECDNRKKFSVPPGFESLTSFTLQKVENNEEACNSVAVGNESEQGPIQVASTPTIISTGMLKTSVRRRPWILDDHVDHMEEDFECTIVVEEE